MIAQIRSNNNNNNNTWGVGASFGSTLAALAHISLSRPCLPGGGGGGVDQKA